MNNLIKLDRSLLTFPGFFQNEEQTYTTKDTINDTWKTIEETVDDTMLDDYGSNDESDTDSSWDKDSDLDEIVEENIEEPTHENAEEVKEIIQRSFEDNRDLASFDPVPIVRSEYKGSQEETMATLESLLQVLNFFILKYLK